MPPKPRIASDRCRCRCRCRCCRCRCRLSARWRCGRHETSLLDADSAGGGWATRSGWALECGGVRRHKSHTTTCPWRWRGCKLSEDMAAAPEKAKERSVAAGREKIRRQLRLPEQPRATQLTQYPELSMQHAADGIGRLSANFHAWDTANLSWSTKRPRCRIAGRRTASACSQPVVPGSPWRSLPAASGKCPPPEARMSISSP